jgi:hypothetical protein
MSSRDPRNPGGSADWRLQGEQYRHWGLSSGSVLVPGSRGSSNGAGAAPAAKPPTPTSNWAGAPVMRKTATERGAAAVFLAAVLAAAVFGVRYRDEVLIGLGGLAATGVVYKIASVSAKRRIYLFLVVALGVAATAWAEYSFAFGKHAGGSLSEPLLQWLRAYGNSPTLAKHVDLVAAAGIGTVLAILGFFYARSKRALVAAPLSILAATTAAIGGVSVYQSSFATRYAGAANVLAAKSPPEQSVFASKPAAAPPKVQGRLPKFATVNNGAAPLGLRSCPVSCPVVVWVPNGATVKIVGSGEKGWPEVETTVVGGATFHGFADGTLLR